jgi:hypothetical protein
LAVHSRMSQCLLARFSSLLDKGALKFYILLV